MNQLQIVLFYLTLVALLRGYYCDDGVRDCKDIQLQKQSIYWIGLTSTRFVLVTSSFAVYDLPTSAVDNVKHRVYLSGAKQMSELYPVLWDKRQHDASGFFGSSFILHKMLVVTDEKSEYLYAENEKFTRGMLYDINAKTVEEYDIKDEMTNSLDPVIELSSIESLHFYTIYLSSLKDPSGMLMLGRFADQSKVRESTTLQQQGDQFYFCIIGTTGDSIELNTKSCSDGYTEWYPKGGFVDQYNFYLFATNRTVMVFPKNVIDKLGTPVRVDKIRFEDFFVCGGDDSAATWIILPVIGVIIIFLFLGSFCFFICKQRSRGALVSGPGAQQQQTFMASKQQQPVISGAMMNSFQQPPQAQQYPQVSQQYPPGMQPYQTQLQPQSQQQNSFSKSSRANRNRTKTSKKRSTKSRKTKKKGSKKR